MQKNVHGPMTAKNATCHRERPFVPASRKKNRPLKKHGPASGRNKAATPPAIPATGPATWTTKAAVWATGVATHTATDTSHSRDKPQHTRQTNNTGYLWGKRAKRGGSGLSLLVTVTAAARLGLGLGLGLGLLRLLRSSRWSSPAAA